MGKHTDSRAVDRGGLVRRYAKARRMTVEQAEKVTREWTRSELRDIVETAEQVAGPTLGRHARFAKGQTTTITGITR